MGKDPLAPLLAAAEQVRQTSRPEQQQRGGSKRKARDEDPEEIKDEEDEDGGKKQKRKFSDKEQKGAEKVEWNDGQCVSVLHCAKCIFFSELDDSLEMKPRPGTLFEGGVCYGDIYVYVCVALPPSPEDKEQVPLSLRL
jgi:hypothetical protein